MIFEVKFLDPGECEEHTALMTEDEIRRLQANDGYIISVEPSEASQRQIQAEIESYRNGNEDAFGDAYRR